MTARRYAQNTTVSVAQSQAEIRDMLKALGSDRIAIVDEPGGASVYFEIPPLTFVLRSPPIPAGEKKPEQRARSDWRAIVLLIKAKRVAIKQGITTIEREFLSDAVMPDGSTLADHAPQMIATAYKESGPPRLTFAGKE